MDNPIVTRLILNKKKNLFEKKNIDYDEYLLEKDKNDEEDETIEDTDDNEVPEEEEPEIGSDKPSGFPALSTDSPTSSIGSSRSTSSSPHKKSAIPLSKDMHMKKEETPNPLDNQFAVKHKIGEEISIAYANGTKSNLKATIQGYDKEGFYRIMWSDGSLTNGISDNAISDNLSIDENKCICGCQELITENGYIVCDRCGRKIRETMDQLTQLDTSRSKGKKMIRSIPHPMSTSVKPNISGTITEEIDEEEDFED